MTRTKITIRTNGPIKVEGDFEIVDPEGNPYGLGDRTVAFLCRCGQSSNRPLCDGTHKTCGFVDPGLARDLSTPR